MHGVGGALRFSRGRQIVEAWSDAIRYVDDAFIAWETIAMRMRHAMLMNVPDDRERSCRGCVCRHS